MPCSMPTLNFDFLKQTYCQIKNHHSFELVVFIRLQYGNVKLEKSAKPSESIYLCGFQDV
jgi:hypothetical protein